jgi:multidrug efflux pump subunit AcrA (membrane-fusion protein)
MSTESQGARTSVRPPPLVRVAGWAIAAALVAAAAAGGYFTKDRWLPLVTGGAAPVSAQEHDEHKAAAPTSVKLTDQARKNLGLDAKGGTGTIKVTDEWKTITVPGMLVERPGHSHRKVTAPLTGVVRELFVHPNQLVHPDDPLADLELTGDALATSQAELLAVIRELEIKGAELTRISALVESGALPAKNKLQLEYDVQRLQSQRESKVQALQVLGLSIEQIGEISTKRKLLREFLIRIPGISSEETNHALDAQVRPAAVPVEPPATSASATADEAPATEAPATKDPATDWSYTVESIDVYPGKRVQIGDDLCSLAFHTTLYIEGQAFEKEGELIARALVERWPVKAVFEVGQTTPLVRKNLAILMLDNVVEPASRTFRFYIPLANEVLHDSHGTQGETYRSWRFKPGQKVTLEVPIELMQKVIVLPADAVVREGADAYVFRASGNTMQRQPVTVLHAGAHEIYLDNDGSLYPNETVALTGAYQLNLQLKKAASGPAAHGHSHD